MSYGGTPTRCAKCSLCYVGPEPLCYRCLPLEATTGPGWLPEAYTLKLSAMDVGVLLGALFRRIDDAPAAVPVPAGVLRLLRKLDELAGQIYGESAP